MNKKIVVIVISFLIMFLGIYVFYKYVMYKEKEENETIDYNYQSKCVKEVYKLHPESFVFDSNGICKMTVEQIHTVSNDYGFEIEHDKYGNMCVGYFIIKKSNDNIKVDSSHICDMINY